MFLYFVDAYLLKVFNLGLLQAQLNKIFVFKTIKYVKIGSYTLCI